MTRAVPAVSVALATHNGERFLEAQLHSILEQTMPVAEIVLSDDASRDGTVALARRVIGDRVPLTVLKNTPALGVRENFAAAMSATTAPLIALCDQDDIWHPRRVEAAVSVFASSPQTELLFTDARLVSGEGEPLGSTLFEALPLRAEERVLINSGRAVEAFLRRNLATGATITLRRELFKRALPFPEGWLHDEWLAMLAGAAGTIAFLDEPLIDYRQHGSNQIGVSAPTLRSRVSRVLEPRSERNRTLASRTRILVERLAADPGTDPAVLTAARGKLRIEQFRAGLPAARIRRILPVLREARSGDYERFTSQGRAEILRDLFQPR